MAAISVNCPTCGAGLKVPSERVGRMAKCPACLTAFTVPGIGGAAVVAGAPRLPGVGGHKERGETGSFVVSPTLILFGGIFLLLVAGVMVVVWGPLRVQGEWERQAAAAQDTCEDVVVRGLDCHLSAHFLADPTKGHGGMAGMRTFVFIRSFFVMSMPERVAFAGVSSQGAFQGWYHPTSGEVEADVEVGGTVLQTGILIRHGGGKIHVTGRKKDGDVTVEVDGEPGRIVSWNKKGE